MAGSPDASNMVVRAVNALLDDTNLGYLDGDVEIGIDETTKDVNAHQTGDQALTTIRTAINLTVKLTLKETSPLQLKTILGFAGSTFTPTGSGATPVTGFGSAKLGQSVLGACKKLILRNVSVSGVDQGDYTFWKAYAVLDSIKFSGTEVQTIPVTFKIFRDTTKHPEVDFGMMGDSTQAGLTLT